MPAPISAIQGGISAAAVGRVALSAGSLAGLRAAAGGIGRMVGLQQVMASAGIMFSPINRETQYQSNWASANLVIEPDQAIRAFYSGRIREQQLTDILGWHGIWWVPGQEGQNTNRRAWREVIRLAQPYWDLSDYFHWWKQGRLGDPANAGLQKMQEVLDRAGFHRHPDRDLFLDAWVDLSPDAILYLWLQQFFSPDQAENSRQAAELLKRWGYRDQEMKGLGMSVAQQLTPGDLMALRSRDFITPEQFQKSLGWHGLFGDEQIERLDELRKVIPPPSDQIMFSVREAWSDEVSARFGYDEEFPERFAHWAGKVGLNWGEGQMRLSDGQVVPMTWPRIYWRSHWFPMGINSGYEALHRARGDPNDPATWRIPGVRPFTEADLNEVLKIHDYAPGVREWLRAISFLPLRLVDIRRGVIDLNQDRQWAIANFMDRGSARREAELQADLAIKTREIRTERPHVKRTEGLRKSFADKIIQAHKDGWVTAADASQSLRDLGWREDAIQLAISQVFLDLAGETARLGVRRTQVDYLNGRIDAGAARRRLTLLGIFDDRIGMLITRWNNMRSEGFVQVTAAKLIRAFHLGLIDPVSLQTRFMNLGYNLEDARMLVQIASLDLFKMQAKADAAAAKTAKQAAAELQQLQEEAERKQDEWSATIRRLTPLRSLQTWYKQGLIGDDYLGKRLTAMGYGSGVIAKYLAEAQRLRGEWQEKRGLLPEIGDEEADLDEVANGQA